MTVDADKEAEIKRLYYAEHFKVGTICVSLDVHHEVVERVLGLLNRKPTAPRATLLDEYKPFIKEQLQLYPRLRATRLYDMLVGRGYKGSPRTVRAFVHQVRPKAGAPAFMRLDPLCAEQAQVDWAYVGKVPVPGGERALWVFLFVLSYSRGMWAELVFDLSVHSLCRSLLGAARFLGGLPRQFLFDNPKTVVVERRGEAVRFHPVLLDLCAQLHVQPRLCAVRQPQQKGRVERHVRYLRERFFSARTITSRDTGNQQLLEFITSIAHTRPHPQFRDQTVAQVLAKEQERLLPLPHGLPPVELCIPVAVDKTAFVCFDTNWYSAPPAFAQATLTLCANDTHVRLLHQTEQVACHLRCYGRGQRIRELCHLQQMAAQRRAGSAQLGKDRLLLAFPKVELLFERWLLQGSNLGLLTQRALKLLDLYGADRFARAAQTVLDRGTSDPSALALCLEQLRKQDHAPVPLPLALGSHVPDCDVIPHDLESYDADD